MDNVTVRLCGNGDTGCLSSLMGVCLAPSRLNTTTGYPCPGGVAATVAWSGALPANVAAVTVRVFSVNGSEFFPPVNVSSATLVTSSAVNVTATSLLVCLSPNGLRSGQRAFAQLMVTIANGGVFNATTEYTTVIDSTLPVPSTNGSYNGASVLNGNVAAVHMTWQPTTAATANVAPFADADSGIALYSVSLATTVGSSGVWSPVTLAVAGSGDSVAVLSDATLTGNSRAALFAGVALLPCQWYRWSVTAQSGAGCTVSSQSPVFAADVTPPVLNASLAAVYVAQAGNVSARSSCVAMASGGATVPIAITLRADGFTDSCSYVSYV